MIIRQITDSVLHDFRRKKIIAVMGPRQVGKTTLLSQLYKPNMKVLHLNCDNIDDRSMLQGKSTTVLRDLVAPFDMVFIDEAQRVENIGLTLKMLGDMHLDCNIIATGSSSFDMADQIKESANGRILQHKLFPFSLYELAQASDWRDENRLLEKRLIFGMYPDVINEPGDAKRTLTSLADNYLYKDILNYKGIRKPALVYNLTKALALQVGSEVSFNELAQLLSVDKQTVQTYIDLLEKCFIIFSLDSYSTNQRNEIKKGKKVYFYDNGIRNAIIGNFAPLDKRNDIGALWENFLISERLKQNSYCMNFRRMYFWRSHSQQEIDLIEEVDGTMTAFEFKWREDAKAKIPSGFASLYPQCSFQLINKGNYIDFISPHFSDPQ